MLTQNRKNQKGEDTVNMKNSNIRKKYVQRFGAISMAAAMLFNTMSWPLVQAAEVEEVIPVTETINEAAVSQEPEVEIEPQDESLEEQTETEEEITTETDVTGDEAVEEPIEESSEEPIEAPVTEEPVEETVTEEAVEETIEESVIEEPAEQSAEPENSITTFSMRAFQAPTAVENINGAKTVGYHLNYRTNTSIYSKPTDHRDAAVIGNLSDYKNAKLLAKKVYTVGNQVWLFVSNNGKGLGWILNDTVTPAFGSIYSTSTVAYFATIDNTNYNFYSNPAWVSDGHLVANAKDYLNKKVIIWNEMFTSEGVFVYVSLNGKNIGWINKNAITPKFDSILGTKHVAYRATVKNATYNIYKTPAWATNGHFVDYSANYMNQTMHVMQEKVTSGGTFVLVRINGKEIGWMNKLGIQTDFGRTYETYNVAYDAVISSDYYNIYNDIPWVTDGVFNHDTTAMLGNKVQVMRESHTSEGVFSQVYDNGRYIGWINRKALSPQYVPILSTVDVSYMAEVANDYYNVYKIPAWSTNGHLTAYGKDLLGTKFEVSQLKVTSKGTYALVTINGVQIGWLDTRALVPATKQTIYLDVGHGGSDPGASYFGVQEKTINLQVSNKIKALLEERGYQVITNRTTDVYIDHKTERSRLANETDADIFISVHHNAMPNGPQVNGIETFYYEYDPDYPSKIDGNMHNDPKRIEESAKLATAIHQALISETKAFDRGVRRDTFAVLRETRIPAVLLELGFMSNRAELNLLLTNSYQDKLAKAVADGVDRYFNN